MTEPLPDTWTNRDLPVLREVVRLLDQDPGLAMRNSVIAAATGLSDDDVVRAGVALHDAGLVDVVQVEEVPVVGFTKVSAEARRLTGAWPTPETALDRMIAALEAIAEHTDDEDTRTRAKKLLDGLTGAGKTIGLSVATAAITGQLPGASA